MELFLYNRSERTESTSTHHSDESLSVGEVERVLPERDTEVEELGSCEPYLQAKAYSSNGLLLRLFESTHFDTSMAIMYLFNSKEPGVQSYLGNCLMICNHYFNKHYKKQKSFLCY